VDGSTDLVDWTPLFTNTVVGNPFYFSDPASTNFPWRFYQGRLPCLPATTHGAADGVARVARRSPFRVDGQTYPYRPGRKTVFFDVGDSH